jgi:four helix bundle protein
MRKSALREKSYLFAIKVVKLSQYLQKELQEFILSKQALRSGTAVGALIREAEFAQSNADYIHKFSIALKEANETAYWIDLLKDTGYLELKMSQDLQIECKEIIAMLVSTINTLKKKIKVER